jgi:hypothetical protein
MLGHRGAVQVEVDAVQAAVRARPRTSSHDGVGDALEGVFGDVADGMAPAQADGTSVQPWCRGGVDEAGHRDVDAATARPASRPRA